MKPLRNAAATALLGALLLVPPGNAPAHARAVIVQFEPPDSARLSVAGINDSGTIAGDYLDNTRRTHGYLRTPDGTIVTFDEPSAGARRIDCACVRGLSGAEEVTGYYTDSKHDTATHGFVRSADGTFIEFDVPDSIGTVGTGINARQTVVGYYKDAEGNLHGFLRSGSAQFTTFDPPGSTRTEATAINDKGVIAGWYQGHKGASHGFIRDAAGTMTSFDVPGAIGMFAGAINKTGAIVGYYNSKDHSQHAFVREASGAIDTFDIEGAEATIAESISAKGAITGAFNIGGEYSGYSRRTDGKITTFAVPQSGGTFPESINANGDIAGEVYNVSLRHVSGFLRTR